MINIGDIVAGKLKIEKKLGKGSYGTVFEAMDTALQRTCAAKFIEVKDPQKIVEHLEGQILHKCRSQYVVDVYEVFAVKLQNKSYVVICMEYMDQGSLEDSMKSIRLSIHEAIQIIVRTLFALEHSHRNEVLHRDVKPANIMVSSTEPSKLSDFGIATVLDGRVVGSANGSPVYCAPEVFAKKLTDLRTEVFAVGMSLFQAISHILIWEDHLKDRKIIEAGKTIKHIGYASFIPKKLRRVINIACHANAEKRYQTAREFRMALAPLVLSLDWHSVCDEEWNAQDVKGKDHCLKVIRKAQKYEMQYLINGRRRLNECQTFSSLSDARLAAAQFVATTTFK